MIHKEKMCPILKMVFSMRLNFPKPNGKTVAVDINENNVTFGTDSGVKQVVAKGEGYNDNLLPEENDPVEA